MYESCQLLCDAKLMDTVFMEWKRTDHFIRLNVTSVKHSYMSVFSVLIHAALISFKL